MISLIWVFFLSFLIYAFVIKPGQYPTETINGNFLPSGSTQQELALITSAPRVDGAAIQERADIATCAYISGNAALPLTCPSGSSCTPGGVLNENFLLAGGSWKCCDELQCQGDYKYCGNYGVNLCPGLEDQLCSQIYTSILYCSSDSPSCVSYARSSSLGDFTVQFSLGCGKSGGAVLARYLATGGNDGEGSLTSGGISPPSTVVSQSIGILDTFSSSGPTGGNDGEARSTSGGVSAQSTVVSQSTHTLDTFSSSGPTSANEDEASSTSGGIPGQSTVVSQSIHILDTFSSSGSTSEKGKGNDDEASLTSGGISGQSTVASQSTDILTDPTPSDRSNPVPNSSKDKALSPGVIAEIVGPIGAVLVAIVVGWWKRHQAVWCITCGRHGHQHSIRPPAARSSVPHEIELSTVPARRDTGFPPGYGSQSSS